MHGQDDDRFVVTKGDLRGVLSLIPSPTPSPAIPDREEILGVLRALIRHVEDSECQHEDTHRGGAIWTICDGCGKKWADDEGGFVPYAEPAPLIRARSLIAKLEGKS